MKTRLLAFDQATRTTGFAIFEDDHFIDVNKFTLTDEDIGNRLVKFRDKVIRLIKDNNINKVAMEEIQLQQNVDTFKKLAMVYGTLLEIICELELPYEIISSNTWKSKCKIKKQGRSSEKKQAQSFVTNLYGIKVTEDESDAICIGYCSLNTKKDFCWS